MSFHIIYDSATGRIISSEKLNSQNLDIYLSLNPDVSALQCEQFDYKSGWAVDVESRELIRLPDEVIGEEIFLSQLRGKRNDKLAKCDWTQLPDSSLTDSKKAEWATYRQALRDMPSQTYTDYNIDNVMWPTEPE